jgi:hypothetical protein
MAFGKEAIYFSHAVPGVFFYAPIGSRRDLKGTVGRHGSFQAKP